MHTLNANMYFLTFDIRQKADNTLKVASLFYTKKTYGKFFKLSFISTLRIETIKFGFTVSYKFSLTFKPCILTIMQ